GLDRRGRAGPRAGHPDVRRVPGAGRVPRVRVAGRRSRDGRRVGRAERGRPAGAARGVVTPASFPAPGHDRRGGAVMSGVELFLGGFAALAVLSVVVKARAGAKKARAAAEIARVGTSPVSLVGHVLITAGLIV